MLEIFVLALANSVANCSGDKLPPCANAHALTPTASVPDQIGISICAFAWILRGSLK